MSLFLNERVHLSIKFPDDFPDRIICTNGILGCLPNIDQLRKTYDKFLDFEKIGSHSLNDFL